MKVLITSDWYTPAVNGVVTSIMQLRRELLRRGHDVRVLTLSQTHRSTVEDGVTALGSITAGLVYPGARLRTALGMRQVRELVAWKPDVVHSQCEFSTFFIARHIARETNAPLIHTYHTVYEDYTHYFSPSARWGRKAAEVFSRWVSRRTDCFIAPTEKVRDLLVERYDIACPVYVIPSGIDLRLFRRSMDEQERANRRTALGIPAENAVLLYLGRLAEEKNIDELLRFRAAMGVSCAVTLLIVGGGPYRERLENYSAELGLSYPAVIFAGQVPPEQVSEWYRLGDLFVSGSTSETQGLTYIEAMAAGLPLLCRKDSCLDCLVFLDQTGWQYQDESDFLSHVNNFLANPDHWRDMGRNARELSEDYSSERFGERVEAIYLERTAQDKTQDRNRAS